MARKDAWRAYYQLALGLTENSRKKAAKIAKKAAGKGGVAAGQLQELVSTAIANRKAVAHMIKVEVDRALGRVGLATMEEVEELTKRVRDLERELAATRAASAPASPDPAAEPVVTPGPDAALEPVAAGEPVRAPVASRPAAGAPVVKTTAKKAVAKKAVATPATEAPVQDASVKRVPAKKAATEKAPAKKTAARKIPAKKASS